MLTHLHVTEKALYLSHVKYSTGDGNYSSSEVHNAVGCVVPTGNPCVLFWFQAL